MVLSKRVDMTKFSDLAYRVNPKCSALADMLISVTCSSKYHLAYVAHPPMIMFITVKLLSTNVAYYLFPYQLHYPYHGLFASTFKVFIGFHWLFHWQGMREQDICCVVYILCYNVFCSLCKYQKSKKNPYLLLYSINLLSICCPVYILCYNVFCNLCKYQKSKINPNIHSSGAPNCTLVAHQVMRH